LFELSFGRALGEQRLRWRLEDNPAGAAMLGLAWVGSTLVAASAHHPVTLHVSGRDLRSAFVGMVMTHPQYRGQGLFRELIRRTWGHLGQSGVSLVWGFPNSISHSRFMRDLHAVDIHEVPTLRLLLGAKTSLPARSGAVEELTGFDDRFDDLWARVRDNHQAIAKRDRQHLQWRYVQNPSERYRIFAYVSTGDVLGYAVLKHYRQEVQVVDLLTAPEIEVGVQLLSQAAHVGLESSASAVGLWLAVARPLHWELEKLGFRNGAPITYLGAMVLRPELLEIDVYDYRHWYLTMGDSDVF